MYPVEQGYYWPSVSCRAGIKNGKISLREVEKREPLGVQARDPSGVHILDPSPELHSDIGESRSCSNLAPESNPYLTPESNLIDSCRGPSWRLNFILEYSISVRNGNGCKKKYKGKNHRESVKRPFCCTVSILQVYFTYLCYITFWALERHFIENLKLIPSPNFKNTVLVYSTAYNLWTFTWFVHFELPFRLKGTEKIHTKRFF